MLDFAIQRQLKALNNIAICKYLSTGAHTFSASSTGSAYRIVGLRAWRAKSMTNSLCVNSSVVTSATTMAAGTELTGRITAITINAGRAIAYLAPDAVLIR